MSWSDYIRDDLRAKIRGGAVPERLTLHSLSRQYAVSITPVRAAIDALVTERLLVRGENGRLAINLREAGKKSAGQLPAPPPRDYCEEVSRELIGQSLRGKAIFVREEQTAERFGISAAVMREVFHRLAGSGVLEHLPRRGWRLRPFRHKDLDDYLEVREVMELTALQQAWPHLVDADLIAMRDGNRLPAGKNQPPVIDDSLHAYIVEKADNVYISDFFRRNGRYFRILFHWDAIQSDRDSATEAVVQHQEILAAMLRRNRRAAKTALAYHIRTNYGRQIRRDGSPQAAFVGETE